MIKLNLGKIIGPPGKDGKGQTNININDQLVEKLNFDSEPQEQLDNLKNQIDHLIDKNQKFIPYDYSSHENITKEIFINNPIVTKDHFITNIKNNQDLEEIAKYSNILQYDELLKKVNLEPTSIIIGGTGDPSSYDYKANAKISSIDIENKYINFKTVSLPSENRIHLGLFYAGLVKDVLPHLQKGSQYWIKGDCEWDWSEYLEQYGYDPTEVPEPYSIDIIIGVDYTGLFGEEYNIYSSMQRFFPLILGDCKPNTYGYFNIPPEEYYSYDLENAMVFIGVGLSESDHMIIPPGVKIQIKNLEIGNIGKGNKTEPGIINLQPTTPIKNTPYIESVTDNSFTVNIDKDPDYYPPTYTVECGKIIDIFPKLLDNIETNIISITNSINDTSRYISYHFYIENENAEIIKEKTYYQDNIVCLNIKDVSNKLDNPDLNLIKLKINFDGGWDKAPFQIQFYIKEFNTLTVNTNKNFDNPFIPIKKINTSVIKESWGNQVVCPFWFTNYMKQLQIVSPLIHYNYAYPISATPEWLDWPPSLIIFTYENEVYIDLSSLCDFNHPEKYYQISMYYCYGGFMYGTDKEQKIGTAISRLMLEYTDGTKDYVDYNLTFNITCQRVDMKINTNLNKTIKALKFYPIWFDEKYKNPESTPENPLPLATGIINILDFFFNSNPNIPTHLPPVFFDNTSGEKAFRLYRCNTPSYLIELPMSIYSIDKYNNYYAHEDSQKEMNLSYYKEITNLIYNGTENWKEHSINNNLIYFSCDDFNDNDLINYNNSITFLNKNKNTINIGFCSLLNFNSADNIMKGEEGISVWNDGVKNHLILFTSKFNLPGSLNNFKEFLRKENLILYVPCQLMTILTNINTRIPLSNQDSCLSIAPNNMIIDFNNNHLRYHNYIVKNNKEKKDLNIFTAAENITYDNEKNIKDIINGINNNLVQPEKTDKYKIVTNINGKYQLTSDVILRSPNNDKWKLIMSDTGKLSTEKIE